MKILKKGKIIDFYKIYPTSEQPLTRWLKIVKETNYKNFNELKCSFSSVDKVGKLTVFNIGGNKFRLVVIVKYSKNIISVEKVLTHEEYNLGKWKDLS